MHTNKQKSKSKSHRWGAWSEWTWDSSQQASFRVRQDSQGHLDYEWDQQDLNQPGHSRTPREAPVEDLTDRLNCLSTTTDETHFDIPEEYATYAGEAPSEQVKSSKTKSKSKDKEKSKSHRRHASSDGKSSAASHDDAEHSQNPNLQFVETVYGNAYQQQSPTANVNYSQYGSGRVTYSSAWASRTRRYAAFTDETEVAGSSSQTGSAAAAAQQYDGEEFDGHGQVRSESNGGSPTPQQSETAETADADYMPEMAENGETELDPRYQIEHSARFQPGEIFKVHWSEPQGSMSEKPKPSSSSSSSSSKKQDLENKFGTKFFVGFRRFIVVANDQGHCTCVPILTYGGKGCKKHGVKPEKHGIVCERGGPKPKRLDGEPALGFAPVRVEMTEAGERLARESRVNYSKLVTVEHNVKVFFIGHVYPSDWQIVGDAVNYCWNKKIHQKQQRHK